MVAASAEGAVGEGPAAAPAIGPFERRKRASNGSSQAESGLGLASDENKPFGGAVSIFSNHVIDRKMAAKDVAYMIKCLGSRWTEQDLQVLGQLETCLRSLGWEGVEDFSARRQAVSETEPKEATKLMGSAVAELAQRWKLKDAASEMAFRGLLLVLEHCLAQETQNATAFQLFVDALNYHTVFFWKQAVPILFDSDMTHGTSYRDALLFSLALLDVNKGGSRLRELFVAVPGLRDSFLGTTAKRFEEAFHSLLRRRSQPSSARVSVCGELSGDDLADDLREVASAPVLPNIEEDEGVGAETPDPGKLASESIAIRKSSGYTAGSDGVPVSVSSIGLSRSHFEERVINVSNAPPVSLSKDEDGDWQIGQGSGGLVTCCGPVLAQNPSNMWLASFGPMNETFESEHSTNSLGIPIIRTAKSAVQASVLEDEEEEDKDKMGLVSILQQHNKESSYKLNPVVVQEQDYQTYYGGISNGLLWPAFHGLQEYIVADYEDPQTLRDHWAAYVRVNYTFALNAVRNSRPQDFIWIHDYHLILTGNIIESLDSQLEVGFFLHIPFQPPADFFDPARYGPVGMAVLRALLRFTKVGFQTHADRDTFVALVRQHLPAAKVRQDKAVDSVTVRWDGWTASLGVFPVSVKNEAFLTLIEDKAIQERAKVLHTELHKNIHPEGRVFFSVERFDYTKGIQEKLAAWDLYMKSHPERHGKDVLYQVAVTNRRGVDTYRKYQDDTIAEASRICDAYWSADFPQWKPIIFQTTGMGRPELVARYLAMDIGVVTPKKDGMNLVAKEMVLCNPKAGLVLSCGAGTQSQLSAAGFYPEEEGGVRCYTRVKDVADIPAYAEAFHEAAEEPVELRALHGQRLREFIVANDIERWSATFLDPAWSHHVIRKTRVAALADFYALMFQTRNIRRQIVERILKGVPIKPHFAISLQNALETLKDSRGEGGNLALSVESSTVELGVKDEVEELEQDLAFLRTVSAESEHDIETFIGTLEANHKTSPEAYRRELDAVMALMGEGQHFDFFFTDRDGTLKPYAGTYASSIQPSYSGVIQATFAQRCAQVAAVVTSAPLLNVGILDVSVMPDGHFAYGASCGREWYVEASRKFKDTTIPEAELELMERLFERLEEVLEEERWADFRWLGSGLQKHYGQLTVAKQDVYGTVDPERAREWLALVSDLVLEVDPKQRVLLVSASDTDIKVHLRMDRSKGQGVFHKGHGIRLFASTMGYDLSQGRILVCGDSETDLPMLEECLGRNPKGTHTVWVTACEGLQQRVRKLCQAHGNERFAFAACPSVLLGAMAQATIREIAVRNEPVSFMP